MSETSVKMKNENVSISYIDVYLLHYIDIDLQIDRQIDTINIDKDVTIDIDFDRQL